MDKMKFLLLVLIIAIGTPLAAVKAAAIDESAPDFVLKSHTGSNLRLSELRGQVVMINFWASWCGPCRQEMPLLESLHKRYQKLGFTLLGVNVEEDTRAAKAFLKDTPVSFPILYDTENNVSRMYKVAGMPSTVVLDRDGKLRFRHTGYVPGDEAEYSKVIRALMKK